MSNQWAGVLVARLNNTTLEDYMQKNIWTPLGINNITFHLELKPEVKAKKATLSYREGIDYPIFNLPADTGKPVAWTEEPIYDDPVPIGDDYGGQGSYGSATEYIKILHSILLDDGKILKPETVNLMFTPNLPEGPKKAMKEFYEAPWFKDTFASHQPEIGLDWGLAGLVTLDDEATGRKKGTLTWSGLPNLLWTIDREAGLATFYASNVVPFGDHKSAVWQMAFEKEMYSRLEKSSKL
jgi:CubicO group peptidase (beta-lactamase class C family)